MKELFGTLPGGEPVYRYTISDGALCARILDYGGILQDLVFNGRSVVCGFDNVDGYLIDTSYQGALIGRYANRIKDGRFCLNGKEYVLAKNEKGICHLHGGECGFDKKIWTVENATADTLTLSLFSPDMEEGYPGNLKVSVTYTVRDAALLISYTATSDKDTYLNMTNHSYFNMDGLEVGDIRKQRLSIDADTYTEVDEVLIPIEHRPVDGTPFDLRTAKEIGWALGDSFGGYDHNFNLNKSVPARVFEQDLYHFATAEGQWVRMKAYTDQPCVQLYASCALGGEPPFRGKFPKRKHLAFCLETQVAPDSPNRNPEACLLKAGDTYKHNTVFAFEEI